MLMVRSEGFGVEHLRLDPTRQLTNHVTLGKFPNICASNSPSLNGDDDSIYLIGVV